jgi:outer membrane receptor protein involved in Fe transport
MKHIYLLLFLFLGTVTFAQTSIEGKLKDEKTGEPILFGTVALYKNGVLLTGVETDIDGNYFITNLTPGSYDVEAKYLGYTDIRKTGVLLKSGQTTRVNFEMNTGGVLIDEIVVIEYKVPLIDVDNTTSGTIITSEKIATLPVKNLNSIVATAAGISSQDGSQPSIRGSRSNETMYIIDGIRTFGSIPQSEIEQLQIITGGIEAQYGDVTGGIISLTSKGPSNKLSGGFDLETSEGLTPYGYNLAMGYLSGPILKDKNGKSKVGYRVSGQYRNIKDGGPNPNGVWRAPADVVARIEENPMFALGSTLLPSAQLLRTSDLGGPVRARPTDGNVDLNLTAKIDAIISSAMDLSISGAYVNTVNQFTPGGWGVLNWQNNPFSYTSRLRTNFRLRHKLGKQSFTAGKMADRNVKPATLQNFSYTLLGGFERGNSRSEDVRHEDNLFNYGFLGNRNAVYNPVFGVSQDSIGNPQFGHVGYAPTFGEFVPGTENSVLAKYNFTNGLLDPDRTNVWSDLYSNAGQVNNTFSKSQNDLYTANIMASFDLLPNGSEKGRHSIQLGFLYEQRVNSSYNIAPRGLWRAADLLVNNHIKGINQNIVLRNDTLGQGLILPIYQTLIQPGEQDKFYKAIREKLGVGVNQYVNMQGLKPSDLSLNMFSAEELTSNGLVSFSGYDYLGNKTSGNTSFEDFFKAKDENGIRSFPIAPFTPIYMAAFIQDKFSYKDIIFRIGVRMDYYDANTKVLKDPYALYEIESAKDFYARTGKEQPASISDDYSVYVTGEESDDVKGFRKGDQWYTANGTSVTNGTAIFNGGIVHPAYVGRKASGSTPARVLNIQDPAFDVNTSFRDYKPAINFSPRLAFSFPISEDAGFFAHYDVLYQRPPSNSFATPLTYYYFSGGTINNPDLRPIRTTDYEVGFQQKLTANTALKLAGYSKETKDLVQNRAFANVPSPINSYNSFGNLDFGNITGFSFTFDRRRVNNLELNFTYTIQFANGSGSDANSSANINNRGVIRNLIPLSFDERHRVTSVIDYRYAAGKKYNGPVVGGYKILENAGITLTTIAVSGQPFTKRQIPAQYGGTGFLGEINGSRLPWNFNMDLRFDKRFTIKPNEKSKPMYPNLYFRVQNLLDARNVSSVYSASGSPTDDGFLVSNLGQNRVNDVIRTTPNDIEAFNDQYSWALISNGNFFLPRRMFIGITFDF